jgi:hypothetical protein
VNKDVKETPRLDVPDETSEADIGTTTDTPSSKLQYIIGYRGDRIGMHRSMRKLAFPPLRWVSVLVLPLLLTIAFFLAWPRIALFWGTIISLWSSAFDGEISLRVEQTLVPLLGPMPYVYTDASLPTATQWFCGLLITLLCLVGPQWLSGRALPLAYGIRFVGLIQATAQIYFYFWPADFPYDGGRPIASLTQASVMLILITPWLYALLYNILDFGFTRKLVLSTMAMIYLIVLVPLQYALAALIMFHFSLLWCPQIFMIGGIFLQIGTLVALYAWAMSWQPRN